MTNHAQQTPEVEYTLLTDKELKALTGLAYKQPQIDWLKSNRIPHLVDANGRAKVYRINAINAGFESIGGEHE